VFKSAVGVVVHVQRQLAALPDHDRRHHNVFDSIPASMPLVKSGKLRVLAVASSKRITACCPTSPPWPKRVSRVLKGQQRVYVRWGTPPAVIAALARAIQTAIESQTPSSACRDRRGTQIQCGAGFGAVVEQGFITWGKAVNVGSS
jgi:tripartite-type tricarboxylate transporter receptor subunit TctC